MNRQCAICMARAGGDGVCLEWPGHTMREQQRVMRERDEFGDPVMTPREVYDAWNEQIDSGHSEAFERMLRQLRDGLLEMVVDGDVTRIQARRSPVTLRTQEEKVAFRKAWDAQVEAGWQWCAGKGHPRTWCTCPAEFRERVKEDR